MQASHQWATRPADERFGNLREMYNACVGYARAAQETVVEDLSRIRVVADDGDLLLRGRSDARLSHHAFGQLTNLAKFGKEGRTAPENFLRTLPADIVSNILNLGVERMADEDKQAKLLFHRNNGLLCRAFTTPKYTRIWNYTVLKYLLTLEHSGWRAPPARPSQPGAPGSRIATEADVLNQGNGGGGLAIKVGDIIAPAGLYASNTEIFAFMVNDDVRIEDGSDGGLGRGFFLTNSEVGGTALKLTKFLYRYVCGNHIVWDAKQVTEFRICHRGRSEQEYAELLYAELKEYVRETAKDDEARIVAAQNCILGSTKDEVIEVLFGKKIAGLSKNTLLKVWEHSERENAENGSNPYSAWGIAQGITHLSQECEFADERDSMDRAAGKVLLLSA
jgi:hypothetical protein